MRCCWLFRHICVPVRNGDDELQIGDSVEIFGLQGGGSVSRPKKDQEGHGWRFGDYFLQVLVMNVHDVQYILMVCHGCIIYLDIFQLFCHG